MIHDLMDLLWEAVEDMSPASFPVSTGKYSGKIFQAHICTCSRTDALLRGPLYTSVATCLRNLDLSAVLTEFLFKYFAD